MLRSINLKILKIELILCGKYSKKRCIVFLFFYICCFTFLLLCLKSTLVLDKHEDCTLQSTDVINKERNSILKLDDSFEKLLRDVIEDRPASSQWIKIASNIYVYSAFLELCPPHLSSHFCVKFIAIVLANSTTTFVSPILPNVNCAVKGYSGIQKEESVTVELLPESHEMLFTAALLFCPVKNSFITHATVYKSYSSNLTWCAVENNNLLFGSNHKNITKSNNLINLNSPQGISVCVRPLYNNYSIARIIEFLIYYSAMEANHFIFYYHKSFKPLKTFLKMLKFSNISNEVFLWDIPLNNDIIHEYGQIAFTQDCLARCKNKFRHSIIVDLDEYIVPQVHKDIKSLVSYLDEANPLAGSYVIPMVLFCYEYSVTNTDISPLHILNHNKRQRTPWLHHYRSKYIVRPERVRYSGIHFTWMLENNFKEVFVSPNIALLNHYRYCCGMLQTWFFHLFEFKVLNDKVIVDDTLANHRDKLTNNYLFKLFV